MQGKYKVTNKRCIPINWIKSDANSWLAQNLNGCLISPPESIYSHTIEKLAHKTNELGAQPLWEGYAGNNIGGKSRMPDNVRTTSVMGDMYTYLVNKKKPKVLVEFGTAFGVSGMYFLAGVESNKKGLLLTFEPNAIWAKIAKDNLSKIGESFRLFNGTFEESIEKALERTSCIDLTFIDAIHTREFVIPQLEIVISKSCSGAIIILDDINFSQNMKDCWREISTDSRFLSSASLGARVGILELGTR